LILEKSTSRTKPVKRKLELKEACILQARAIIAELGIESLSIREVARRLKVSHQAPYKHYPTRDHLLAEVMRRCFEQFKQYLDLAEPGDGPPHHLQAIGRQYLSFALSHPLEYRLMFGTPWPDVDIHQDLLKDAQHAFNVLRSVFVKLHGSELEKNKVVELDALYVWSCMHGIAGLMQTNAIRNLSLSDEVLIESVGHMMQLMNVGLSCRPSPFSVITGSA
jgi:AcrR family transcriptional regulator